jgi:hypothetical protein
MKIGRSSGSSGQFETKEPAIIPSSVAQTQEGQASQTAGVVRSTASAVAPSMDRNVASLLGGDVSASSSSALKADTTARRIADVRSQGQTR